VPHTPQGRVSIDILGSSEKAKIERSVDVVVIALAALDEESRSFEAARDIARRLCEAGKGLAVVCTDPAVARTTIAAAFGVSILDTVVASSKKEILDHLAGWIADTQSDLKLAFAANFEWMRRHIAQEAVSNTALQNGAIGLVVFVPGADFPVMTLNQAKMILQIAAAYGQPMNAERIKELAVVIGGGFAFRYLARTAVGFVPVLGWAIKGAVGYAGTLAMGNAALEYFERGGTTEGLALRLQEVREDLAQRKVTPPCHSEAKPKDLRGAASALRITKDKRKGGYRRLV